MDTSLPRDVSSHPVTGANLPAATLGDVLSGGPTLLVFLRHFG
jgi:hypothetical protein